MILTITSPAWTSRSIGGAAFASDRVPNMQGFIKSYATQGTSANDSHAIMKYFSPEKIPVLTKLATEYAVFNGWFASIPGPTICNRAFAHYGTSFGNVDMNMFLVADADRAKIPTIYERLNGRRPQRKALLLRSAKLHDGNRQPDHRPELLRRVH